MAEPLRPAKRKRGSVDEEKSLGWRGADVTDEERVDDEHIHEQIVDPSSPVRAYAPLSPDDERKFPLGA